MNPEGPQTPREELEVKITALLLGELDDSETASIREAIKRDPELNRLHAQLKESLALVQEASVDQSDAPTPLRLPSDKRDALLARFKTIPTAAFGPPRRSTRRLRLIELAAVLALLGIASAMLLPSLAKSKAKAQRVSVVNNLKQIELAKRMWAEDMNQSPEATPTREDLEPYLGQWPATVKDETYEIGSVAEPARAESRAAGVRLLMAGEKQAEMDRYRGLNDRRLAAAPRPEAIHPSSRPTIQLPTQADDRDGAGQEQTWGFYRKDNSETEWADFDNDGGQAWFRPPDTTEPSVGGSGGADKGTTVGGVSPTLLYDTDVASLPQRGETVGENLERDFFFAENAPEQSLTRYAAGAIVAEQPAAGKAASGPRPATPSITSSTSDGIKAQKEDHLDVALGVKPSFEVAGGAYQVELPEEELKRQDSTSSPGTESYYLAYQPTEATERFGVATRGRDSFGRGTTYSSPQPGTAAPVEQLMSIAEGTAIRPEQEATDALRKKEVDDLRGTESLELAWSVAPRAGRRVTVTDEVRQLARRIPLQSGDAAARLDIKAKASPPEEGRDTAGAVAEMYRGYGLGESHELALGDLYAFTELDGEPKGVDQPRDLTELDPPPARKTSTEAPVPQPEVSTTAQPFSTFSLNVSDVAFKLAAASLDQGQMPDLASIRSEEFINAFDYHDPAPTAGQPLAFAWERARYPFAHNRDLLRFSVQTAAQGREAGRPLNLVLLVDNSGSMERADRVEIIRECLDVLAPQLTPQDRISVVTFARTARLWADGLAGDQASTTLDKLGAVPPEGGTNLEEAMRLAYATAKRHYLENGINRVVLLTDGAANLGNVNPASLKTSVETQRQQGIALDCFGIGWEGYNDDLLEVLSRNGDGRYGFVNSPREASVDFADQLAGALQVAASDVKVQVEFNPARVTAYRQIGYAKHQLTKEQFRDNTVDAAEIGSAESGNALYVIETNPNGTGPLAIVRARYKVPATGDYREYEWPVPYTGQAAALDQASPAMRLAGTASAFSEWLASSPYAGQVSPEELLQILSGIPEAFSADSRPMKLQEMIRQAGRIAGR